MIRAADQALTELLSYLDNYNLKHVSKKKETQKHLKYVFKRYYALLVIEKFISDEPQWPTKTKRSKQFALYMKETVSDTCQSLLLAIQGMYKPGYLILRSAIENFFRCLGIAQNLKVLSIKSTYDLIDTVKVSSFVVNDATARSHFQNLKASYVQLCGYVHTNSSHHMAMTSLAGDLPRYHDEQANGFFKCLCDVIIGICSLSSILLRSSFKRLHHRHRDIIFDALPRTVKQHLAHLES